MSNVALAIFVQFVDFFVTIFNFLIIVRVIMSFVSRPENRLSQWVVSVTEPVMAPVRKMLPRTPGWDLAPLVTYFLLQLVRYGVYWLAGRMGMG